MGKQKETFALSQSQIRLLKLLNIPYDQNLDYYAAGELLDSQGFPKNGIPYSANPSIAKTWSDDQLLNMVFKEKHMKEEHGLTWCMVCKEYHSVYHHLSGLLKKYIDIMKVLVDHQRSDGYTYISQTEIAKELDCSPSLISKKIKVLQKYRAVEVIRRGVYKLLSDSIENTPYLTLSNLMSLLTEKPTLNYKEQAEALGIGMEEVQRAWGMINYIHKQNQ